MAGWKPACAALRLEDRHCQLRTKGSDLRMENRNPTEEGHFTFSEAYRMLFIHFQLPPEEKLTLTTSYLRLHA